MIKRRYMRTRQLKPGMKIDQSIVDHAGRSLVIKGSILDEYVIDSLLKKGIMSVYIQVGTDDEQENKTPYITPQAKKKSNFCIPPTLQRSIYLTVSNAVLQKAFNLYIPILNLKSSHLLPIPLPLIL